MGSEKARMTRRLTDTADTETRSTTSGTGSSFGSALSTGRKRRTLLKLALGAIMGVRQGCQVGHEDVMSKWFNGGKKGRTSRVHFPELRKSKLNYCQRCLVKYW